MKLLLMGAGPLALPVFESLCADDFPHEVVGIVTQPDRVGKGHHQHQNRVKELGLARGIAVLQPESLKLPEAQEELARLGADLAIVAAYGQMVPDKVLNQPRLGTINVHASLLPKYRGATPIHAAILNGDVEAGVTIIRLVKKLDAGPMLGVARLSVLAKETTGELEARLAQLAIGLTKDVAHQLDQGTCVEVVQDESLMTHVGKLTKGDGLIPWHRPAVAVERHVRGMQPWPGPHTLLRQPGRPDLRVQVLRTQVVNDGTSGPAGHVAEATADRLTVFTGEGLLAIEQLQPEGKRPMAIADFLRGRRLKLEDKFCSPE